MLRRSPAHAKVWGLSPDRSASRNHPDIREDGDKMAARKKKKSAAKRGAAKKSSGDLIISKARTKNATKKCNVGSEFYGALDKVVRQMIVSAEGRALGNKRKTLKAVDL